jgi:hypothetical protein
MKKILVLSIVIALITAPAAFGKSLEPPLPADARSAQSGSDPGETAALIVVGGAAALLAGGALMPGRRRRPAAAPVPAPARG